MSVAGVQPHSNFVSSAFVPHLQTHNNTIVIVSRHNFGILRWSSGWHRISRELRHCVLAELLTSILPKRCRWLSLKAVLHLTTAPVLYRTDWNCVKVDSPVMVECIFVSPLSCFCFTICVLREIYNRIYEYVIIQ